MQQFKNNQYLKNEERTRADILWKTYKWQNKHMGRCSISLTIRKCKLKSQGVTTVRLSE